MATIAVKVTGDDPQKSAPILTWDQKVSGLNSDGGGNFSTQFQSSAGTHIYAIVVWGDPGAPWTATVSDGTTTHNHAGHFSPSGSDTTGDTAIIVRQP